MSQTATKPQHLELKRLRDIAARLDSDHDGEVVNAARALVRAAAASGLKVQELIALPSTGFTGAPAQRQWASTGPAEWNAAMERARQSFKAADVERRYAQQSPGAQFKSWRDLRDRIRNKVAGTKLLSADEEWFIYGRLQRGTVNLSSSDLNTLQKIAQKLNII